VRYDRTVRTSIARLTVTIVVTLAVFIAPIDRCSIDCHPTSTESRVPTASHPCHVTTGTADHTWQRAATCDHQHDATWSEGTMPRPAGLESQTTTLASIGGALPVVVVIGGSHWLIPHERSAPAAFEPAGFLLPLRL
jgi:hypothetical protein